MKTSKCGPSISSALLAVILTGMASVAMAAEGSKAAYGAAIKKAEAEYKVDRERCDAYANNKDNQRDICVEEAKAKQKRAKALAKFRRDGTVEAEKDARDAYAEADYSVAKAKCHGMKGNTGDLCLQQAKAARDQAKSQADFREKVLEARHEAVEDQRESQYKVALERCDQLKGNAKDICVAEAKAAYQ